MTNLLVNIRQDHNFSTHLKLHENRIQNKICFLGSKMACCTL